MISPWHGMRCNFHFKQGCLMKRANFVCLHMSADVEGIQLLSKVLALSKPQMETDEIWRELMNYDHDENEKQKMAAFHGVRGGR